MGESLAAANKVLPKSGLNGFDRTFVQSSIPIAIGILRLNFSAKNPRLRQYPNRYAILKNEESNIHIWSHRYDFMQPPSKIGNQFEK